MSGPQGGFLAYCQACGAQMSVQARACPSCGHPVPGQGIAGGSSWWVTFLLLFFCGGLGLHRFYTGHVLLGVIYLLTCGLFGIGTLVDLLLVVSGQFKTSGGEPLRDAPSAGVAIALLLPVVIGWMFLLLVCAGA